MTDPSFADISVIMPAYNVGSCIGRALESIARQTIPPREVIVVDDGSFDNTIETVKVAAAHMNGISIRLFTQPNRGAGAARNLALTMASGKWVAFLDADDQWLPDKLQRSLAIMTQKNLTMSSHNLMGVNTNGEHLIDSRAGYLRDPADPYGVLFLRGFISSSTVVVERQAVLDVGGFDPELRSAQDYELWLSLLALPSTRFETFDDALLRYTLTETGITAQIDRKLWCSLRILERHIGILRRRPGPFLFPVLMRTLIIHIEAIRGHRSHRHWNGAIKALLKFPLNLAKVILAIFRSDGRRPNFLSFTPDDIRELVLDVRL